MDSQRFDDLTRRLAGNARAPVTRRTVLGGLLAAFGIRRGVDAQVTQVYCGNQFCASNPGSCKSGCQCCVYTNSVGQITNSRCRPSGTCSPGTVACPAGLTFCPSLGRCAPCCTDTGCDDGDACTQNLCVDGVCTHPPITCGPNEACIGGVCTCVPNCTNAACGDDDGCGGKCNGTCPEGVFCRNGGCMRECSQTFNCSSLCGSSCTCIFARDGLSSICGNNAAFIGTCTSDANCPPGSFCSSASGGAGQNLCLQACCVTST